MVSWKGLDLPELFAEQVGEVASTFDVDRRRPDKLLQVTNGLGDTGRDLCIDVPRFAVCLKGSGPYFA